MPIPFSFYSSPHFCVTFEMPHLFFMLCFFFFFCLQIPPNLNFSNYWTVSSLLTIYSSTYLQGTRIVPQHHSIYLCSYTHSPGEDVAIPLHTQDTLISVSAPAHEVRGCESLKCDRSCKLWLLSSGNLLNGCPWYNTMLYCRWFMRTEDMLSPQTELRSSSSIISMNSHRVYVD